MSTVPDLPYDNSYDCNGTPAQNWVFAKGSTKVQLSGTNFCLDAGTSTSAYLTVTDLLTAFLQPPRTVSA